ncbi:MAG TPA: hypothetical protein VEJ41_10095 [Candidatus Acidoferrales bacterium]|nr:hypothetical protein [Candidatus Acidoferrales bacterium]
MLVQLGALIVAIVSCANPSIMSAHVRSVTPNNGLNHYAIAIKVTNIGDLKQPGNLLQSLVVLQDGEKVGKIGLQPLGAKQSQTVTYGFDRSVDAGAGTTNFTFMLDFNGSSGNSTSCHAGKETFQLKI